ncbi:DUF420 domain-containing protein [Schlesneria sp.]|uniref:DUF420 domain-containing protein n=1 Tax=Schlesneria sp. TaxID=2762018 RepID=UPI002F06A672
MKDGFLGNHASFMLDAIVVALVLLVPVLIFSLYSVKWKRRFQRHRNLQLALAVTLLVAVFAFEFDLHWVQGGWKKVVSKGPPLSAEQADTIRQALRIHLIFAVTTPFLWATTIICALLRFPHPPAPGKHSRLHALLGWTSAVDLLLTSLTGLVFYYVAFINRG